MFLIAFTCAVASVSSASSFQCSDKTQVQLAGVRPIASANATPALTAQKLRCQGFDSKGPGQLIATCRFADGSFVGCTMVEKGLATEALDRKRRYRLPTCAERKAAMGA